MAKTIHLNDFKGGYATDINYENIPNDTLANAKNIYWQNGIEKREGYSEVSITKPWGDKVITDTGVEITQTLPEKGTIDTKWTPDFAHTTTTSHHYVSWQEDADSYFSLTWDTVRKCFKVGWIDNGTLTEVGPVLYFDDGTDYNDISQELRFIIAWDFPNSLLSLKIITADGTEYIATDDAFSGDFILGDIEGDFILGDIEGDFILGDI